MNVVQTPASRSSDPVTSFMAEDHINENGSRATNQMMISSMVQAKPGLTAAELANEFMLAGFPHLTQFEVSRRLADLTDIQVVKGPRRKCVIKGSTMLTWHPKVRP